LKKFAEIELMDGIDAPTSDITPKTVEKLNKAYKAIFTDIIDLSTPGRKSASASYLHSSRPYLHDGQNVLVWPFLSLLSRNSIFFALVIA
jgi:hypothetical protein